MSSFWAGFIAGFLVGTILIVSVLGLSALMLSSKLSRQEEQWTDDLQK